MKSFVKLFVLILFLFCCKIVLAFNFCGLKNTSFKAGEEITYEIYYHNILMHVNAGKGVFTTKLETYNSKPVYHLTGWGTTFKNYDWLYKIRDTYESFIDTATLLPQKFVRNTDENKVKKYNQILFNQEANTALCGTKVVKMPACIQDVLSAIYYARNIDFSKCNVGDKITFNMVLEDAIYPIYIKYTGTEVLKTKLGTFNTIKFKPLLLAGTLFKAGENMQVWVTNDANKIPIRVESKILVGEVRADVISVKNARNSVVGLTK